ncbi:hypothetical protein EDF46_3347 [Frondihabitans sp. PhB188]|nr:hypothetical protein EDF46_3347 [Frondihabitans sp. PhB188]
MSRDGRPDPWKSVKVIRPPRRVKRLSQLWFDSAALHAFWGQPVRPGPSVQFEPVLRGASYGSLFFLSEAIGPPCALANEIAGPRMLHRPIWDNGAGIARRNCFAHGIAGFCGTLAKSSCCSNSCQAPRANYAQNYALASGSGRYATGRQGIAISTNALLNQAKVPVIPGLSRVSADNRGVAGSSPAPATRKALWPGSPQAEGPFSRCLGGQRHDDRVHESPRGRCV